MNNAWKLRRIEAGVCLRCPNPADIGLQLCLPCSQKVDIANSQRNRARPAP